MFTVFTAVLGRSGVDLDTPFGAQGGDSLLAVRILSKCRRAVGVELPLRELGQSTTPREFISAVRAELGNSGGIEEMSTAPRATPEMNRGQRALLGVNAVHPDVPVYNVPVELTLSGELDQVRLERAFTALVRRHESLRCVFDLGGEFRVRLDAAEPAVEVVDLSSLPAERRGAESGRQVETAARAALDLAVTPMRVFLIREKPALHRLVIVVHHVVCDGISLRTLLRDLVLLYRDGDAAALPELRSSPFDLAHRENAELTGAVREDLAGRWRTLLAGAPELIQLPLERPRPPRRGTAGGRVPLVVPADVLARLRETALANGTTVFAVLASALSLLLRRYTGQDDVVLGFPVARHLQDEPLVGYLGNTVPMRITIDDNATVSELLTVAHEAITSSRELADLPFGAVVEATGQRRDPSYHPVFQVALALLTGLDELAEVPGLDIRRTDLATGTTKFDLSWYFQEVPDGLDGYVEFAADLFPAELVSRMATHFGTLLTALTTAGDDRATSLPLTGADDRRELVHGLSGPHRDRSGWAPVHRMFADHAASTPDHPALWCRGREIGYGELDRATDRLAARLVAHGVRPGQLIGICVERSPAQITAVLAVLKAGAAYLPLDPAYPADRLAYMIDDSGVRVVLTTAGTVDRLGDAAERVLLLDIEDDDNGDDDGEEHPAPPTVEVPESQLAYVIYTSGSTGRPKGVELTHGGVANVITASRDAFGIDGSTRVLQFVSFSFDASVWEIFMGLACGATLCLGPPNHQDAEQPVEDTVRECRATLVYLPPAMLTVIDPARTPSVRLVLTGGDRITPELRDRWLPHARFFAAYGPTEGTIVQTWAECRSPEGQPPIGDAFDNVRLYVLDQDLEPVPRGAVGEVYVGGIAVGRGYRARPGMTADRFVPDPHTPATGERMYRTGDLVRRKLNDELEFSGRVDHQVKIRGYRIELGEVEAALRDVGHVEDAVVRAETAPSGRPLLVAYVLPDQEAAITAEDVRLALRAKLPEHMVPTRLHLVPVFPLTPNGKVDVPTLHLLADVEADGLARLLDQVERLTGDEAEAFLADRGPA
ncbi:amino acid adenylation domain-containing protein [Lentzea sp. NPDC059081]|uniref:non-ribosomal peptide synthetase n=1 Tax=Lentzea sp. NPDC059081 TaxID=3346719 RepID=UPI0036CEF542